MTSIQYKSVFAPGLFDGQIALITGGGTGLGRCIAHELAGLGATVIIAARRKEPLEETCREVQAAGGKIHYYLANIREEASVDALIDSIVTDHGKLDMLVNNAGGQFLSPAENVSVRGFATVLELNAVGTWTVCRAAYLKWFKRHGGRIVNITADFWQGFPLMVHTGAARAAVDNLTKTLAREWGPSGVRINSVAPGTIISSGMKNYPLPVQQLVSETFQSQNPSGRLGTESEVSSAVVWLLSPGASYVNGASIRVDGASSLAKGSMVDFPESASIASYSGFAKEEMGMRDIPELFQGLLKSYRSSKL
ncbi:putative short-chain dehydrogenase [Catenaria anguillulae PL171]|uniref:Peroxisomal trans-2-enoyl-CoA reductase n=1 Tax=Catenaria anguillulae PL171 TaxID=765915 RepID=A0A1Y2HTX1_9FUNG|nr:putative short-chain dehydrogenase [Catenaria anguillulae PL171]